MKAELFLGVIHSLLHPYLTKSICFYGLGLFLFLILLIIYFLVTPVGDPQPSKVLVHRFCVSGQ